MIYLRKDFSRLLFEDRASLVIDDFGNVTPGKHEPLTKTQLVAIAMAALVAPPLVDSTKNVVESATHEEKPSVVESPTFEGKSSVVSPLTPAVGRQDGKDQVTYLDSSGNVLKVMTGGTLSWRCNNPGNFVYPNSWPGVIGKFEVTDKKGVTRRYAIFKSYDAGFNALKGRVKKSADQTIEQFVHDYAPESDGNDERAYVKDIIRNSKFTGKSTVKEVGFEKVALVVKRHEGWSVGTVKE